MDIDVPEAPEERKLRCIDQRTVGEDSDIQPEVYPLIDVGEEIKEAILQERFSTDKINHPPIERGP